MPRDVEGAFRRVRAEIFERAPHVQAVIDEHGYDFTVAQLRMAAHRYKAWQGLRGRLDPEQVKQAKERGERWALDFDQYREVLRRIGALERTPRVIINEGDVITYLYELFETVIRIPPLRALPTRLNPRSRPGDMDGLFAGWQEERDLRLPPDLLAELMGILGDLVAKFLEQLEEVGRFELPPILPAPVKVEFRRRGAVDPGRGVGGQLPEGFEISDVGTAITIAANVGAGATVTQASPLMSGPGAIERIALWSDLAFAGSVQLNVQGAGVLYGGAAGFAEVFGEPLLQGASNVGAGGAQIPWTAFGQFAEFWPRRVIARSSYRVILTVSNASGAPRWLIAALDRREVRAT